MGFMCHTNMLQVLQVHVSSKLVEVRSECEKIQRATIATWDEMRMAVFRGRTQLSVFSSLCSVQVTNELLVHWDKASVLPRRGWTKMENHQSGRPVGFLVLGATGTAPSRLHRFRVHCANKQCKRTPKPLSRNTIHHRVCLKTAKIPKNDQKWPFKCHSYPSGNMIMNQLLWECCFHDFWTILIDPVAESHPGTQQGCGGPEQRP